MSSGSSGAGPNNSRRSQLTIPARNSMNVASFGPMLAPPVFGESESDELIADQRKDLSARTRHANVGHRPIPLLSRARDGQVGQDDDVVLEALERRHSTGGKHVSIPLRRVVGIEMRDTFSNVWRESGHARILPPASRQN